MLFDLEDYRTSGIVGVARKSIGNVYWLDSYTTWRATHDAYRRAVNEWCLASDVMASLEDRHQLMLNYIDINDKFTDSFRKGKIFFNALCSKSIPVEIVAANGITEGTALRIFVVYNGESWYNDFIDLPNLEYPWGAGNKYVLYVGEDSPNGYSELIGRSDIFVYTTMTQTIYDAHKNAIVDLQAKIKETYILAEGISDIPEWIAPAIPVWEESAELSGYVRDSRSLPISGATVRLVDADGINHDLVTNDLGYYHFTKEYIYNNISFGTASSVEFDMFVLEETISGTVLYDQTNKFQSSFFGAINDRGLSWSVLVKSGKPNRRNFKIEVVPDYSDYASISGTILDQDGNPVQNALVELKYYDEYGVNNGQYLNGQNFDGMYMPLLSLWSSTINIGDTYKNGVWSHTTKYTLFGEEKSLLTDENGHYEYSSQMVGEWVNNHLFKALQDQGFDMSETSIYRKILKHNANKVEKGMAPDKVVDGALGRIHMSNDTSASTTTKVQFLQNGKILVSFLIYDSSYADNVCYNGVSLNVPGKNNTYGNKIYSGILKLNADYTLDETFSISNLMPDVETTGKEIFEVNTMTELSDGKILVTGTSVGNRIHENVFYVLNSDGTIYTNPSINLGMDLLNNYQDSNGNYYFRDNDWGVLTGIVQTKVLSDGRILAVTRELKDYGTEGYGSPVGFWNFGPTYVLRILNQDGTIDIDGIDISLKSYQNIYGESFGGGIYPAEQIEFLKMVVLGDNIFLSGKCQFETSSGYSSLGVVKIGMDGVVDETFRFEMTKNPEDSGETRSISDALWIIFNSGDVLADGSIVVNIIEKWPTGNHDSYLRKHNSDGSITIQPIALDVNPTTYWDSMVPVLMNLTPSGDIIHKFESLQINKDSYLSGMPIGDGIADIDNVWAANVHLINTTEGQKLVIIGGGLLYTIDLTTMTLDNRYYVSLMNDMSWGNLMIDNPDTPFRSFVLNNSVYMSVGYMNLSIKYLKEDEYGSSNYWNGTDLAAGRYSEMNKLFVKFDYDHFNIFDNVYRSQSEEFTNPLNLNEKSYKTYTVNTLMVWLNPWVQDPFSGNVYNYYHKRNSLGTEPQKIYAYDNWFNSRFPYSFNTRPDGDFERYSVEAYGGEELVLNIQEVLTNDESGAERLRVQLFRTFDNYGNNQWDGPGSITFKSSTGYVRVKGSFGDHIIGYGQTGSAYDLNEQSAEGAEGYFGFTPNFNNAIPNEDGTYDVYFYSCEPNHGAASGYITYANPYHLIITEFDLTEMAHLENLRFMSRIAMNHPTPENNTSPLDVSPCTGLKALTCEEYGSWKLNLTGLNQLPNIEYLNLQGAVYTSKPEIQGEFQYVTDMSQVRPGSGSPCDRTGVEATDVVKLSSGKYIVAASAPYGWEADIHGNQRSLPNMRYIMCVNPEDLSFDLSFNRYDIALQNGDNYRGFDGMAMCVDKQSDDKIIVGGRFESYNQNSINRGLARLSANGVFDNAFNNNMGAHLTVNDGVYDIKVLSDDKILVMGDMRYDGNWASLIRLNANGSVDNSFTRQPVDSIRRICVQSTGKILVSMDGYIKRLNANGTIDSTFTEIAVNGEVRSISVLSDDSFILAGWNVHTYDITGSSYLGRCSFAKYGADGELDHAFTKEAAKYYFGNSYETWTNNRVGEAHILSDDTIVITADFSAYKYFANMDVDYPDDALASISTDQLPLSDFNSTNYTNDIKLVVDTECNVKLDYLPITTGWGLYGQGIQTIIEDGDTMIIANDRQLPVRTPDGMSEESYFQGLGRFFKRPKTKYALSYPSSSTLKVLRDHTFNGGSTVDGINMPNLSTFWKDASGFTSLSLSNLGNLKELRINGLGNGKVWGSRIDATVSTDGSMTNLEIFGSWSTNVPADYAFLASPKLKNISLEGWGPKYPINPMLTNQILQLAIDGEEVNGQMTGRFASDENTGYLIDVLVVERGWYIYFY